MFELIGLSLEFLGVAVILVSQAIFLYKGKKKCGSIKKFFLRIATPQLGIPDKELRRLSKEQENRQLERFLLAGLLYDDFKLSVIGLSLAVIGMILRGIAVFL